MAPRTFGAAALLALVLGVATPSAGAEVIDAVDRYQSDGRSVTIEGFAPARPGRHPAVILLHGSGGLEQATGDTFRRVAIGLAGRGYVAFIPHLFEKTGHRPGAPFRDGEYESLLAAAGHAIDYAAKLPEVDPDRVGFIGYSMGAGMATSLGARDARIKALVNCSGAYPPGLPRRKIPPLLILHGGKDAGTPLAYVHKYAERLSELEIPHSVHVYKASGHNFSVDTFADVGIKAARFFDRHLNDAPARAIEPAPSRPAPAGPGPGDRPAPIAGVEAAPDPTSASSRKLSPR